MTDLAEIRTEPLWWAPIRFRKEPPVAIAWTTRHEGGILGPQTATELIATIADDLDTATDKVAVLAAWHRDTDPDGWHLGARHIGTKAEIEAALERPPRMEAPLRFAIAEATEPGPIWASKISDPYSGLVYGHLWVTATDACRGGMLWNPKGREHAPEPIDALWWSALNLGPLAATTEEPTDPPSLLDFWWQNPPEGLAVEYRFRARSLAALAERISNDLDSDTDESADKIGNTG